MRNHKKQVFYHSKDNKKATLIYHTTDDVKEIKDTMSYNYAVLDAIYNEKTGNLAIYNPRKGYSRSDYLDNLDPVTSPKSLKKYNKKSRPKQNRRKRPRH